MATTDRLNITLLDSGQKSKETTINTALTTLDQMVGAISGIYATSGLPTAGTNENAVVMVNDIAGSELWVCYSDGTNWRKVVQVDNTIVV